MNTTVTQIEMFSPSFIPCASIPGTFWGKGVLLLLPPAPAAVATITQNVKLAQNQKIILLKFHFDTKFKASYLCVSEGDFH